MPEPRTFLTCFVSQILVYTGLEMAQHTGWVIVEFSADESVSEVPSDWVVGGGVCYWPPYKPSRMTVAIKNCELRDESWEKLAVSVFPGGICCTLKLLLYLLINYSTN